MNDMRKLMETVYSFMEEEKNPEDVVKVDVPLLIRLLEFAREDAKTDMDLHDLAERLVKYSSEKDDVLNMDDYDELVADLGSGKEFKPEEPEQEDESSEEDYLER